MQNLQWIDIWRAAMLKYISDPKLRTNWSDFVVQDEFAVDFLVDTTQRSASESMILLMLAQTRFSMFNDEGHIGYGAGDVTKQFGCTEQEAYSEWLKQLRKKDKAFQSSLPLRSISQTQYDALFSVFYHTGSWKRLNGLEGVYDLEYAVLSENWTLVADIINNGIDDLPDTRRLEARVLQLADYSTERTRAFMRNKGIARARRIYKAGNITDQSIVRQLEFAYYRQTAAFLPRMTELRKRELLLKVGRTVDTSTGTVSGGTGSNTSY